MIKLQGRRSHPRRSLLAVPVVMFLFTWTLTTHGKYSVSGDEPHYLMIAESLVTDHDLDVANNYAHNDGRLFGHDHLAMGLHAVPSRTGRVLPIHDVGLAVALVPVYAVARAVAQYPSEGLLKRFRMDRGLFTYSLISLFLIAVTAAGFTLLASGLMGRDHPWRVTALVLAIGISPPIVSHAFLVFPELAALFVTCVVVWFSLKPPGVGDRPMLLGLLLMLGVLPWTHHKYLLYVPGLLFVIAWTRWTLIRTLRLVTIAAGALLFVGPQLALQAWTWRAWGTFGGALTTQGVPFSLESLQRGLVGLWIDRQSGLLAYAPLYWIVPACWWLTWKRTWAYMVPFLLLYLPAAAFVIGWWAGFAPAARYLVPSMPLLLVPVAGALQYRAVRVAILVVLVPQGLIDAVIWQHPRWLWPAVDGNLALRSLGLFGRVYDHALVGVQAGAPMFAAIGIGAVAAIGSAAVVRWAPKEQQELGGPAGRGPSIVARNQ